jgi:hypothetical protein
MTRATLNRIVLLAVLAAGLAGCKTASTVRITNEKPAAEQAAARSEPIFYNGKTYKLDFAPRSGGVYDMAVSGMSSKQKKDAVAVATSSLGYFACPDGQKGRLQNDPAYADAKWRMQAKCG